MSEHVEILLATMNQTDFSLVEKMNIRCGAVIANQNAAIPESVVTRGSCRMITTHTRGLGINRNISLLASEGNLLLFADDDVIYNDGVPENVERAFHRFPQADVIIFSMNLTKNGKVYQSERNRNRRLHIWNAMKYGSCVISVRKSSLMKKRIAFSHIFGSGALYSSGEDSLFLLDCFKKGLKVYSYDYCLGSTAKDSSSWFTGYNEKYYYDMGAWIHAAFPHPFDFALIWYFAFRFRGQTQLSFRKTLRLMWDGINGSKTLRTYSEYRA